jgi:hypothetical protein
MQTETSKALEIQSRPGVEGEPRYLPIPERNVFERPVIFPNRIDYATYRIWKMIAYLSTC